MKDIGFGKDYKYAHQNHNNFIEQEFFPKELKAEKIYKPGNNSKEKAVKDFLERLWKGKY